jgi:hypothetical protein
MSLRPTNRDCKEGDGSGKGIFYRSLEGEKQVLNYVKVLYSWLNLVD